MGVQYRKGMTKDGEPCNLLDLKNGKVALGAIDYLPRSGLLEPTHEENDTDFRHITWDI